MLLDRYEPLFFNANFKEAASTPGYAAYRGELVLQEGEVADAQGRRKPPSEVMKQAILLANGDALQLISGSLDQLQQFPLVMEKLGAAFTPSTSAIFFVVDIPKPFVAEEAGCPVVFIPLVQGMVWNELIDLVALEKGDFKGQGAADKVVTLANALAGWKPKFAPGAVAEALKTTTNAKRETHGAV